MLKLKELRENANLTQTELGNHLNLSQRTISAYENATNEPDIQTLIKISKFFNVTIDYLLGQESNNKQINISNQELESFTKLSNDLSKTINNIKIKNELITNSTINTVDITYKNNPKKE